MKNKIRGSLYGFAIGDAMGATTEFMSKESIKKQYGKVTDINLTEILKDCTPEQKQEMMTVLKQMSGENLLHINDKVKNFICSIHRNFFLHTDFSYCRKKRSDLLFSFER